MKAGVILIDTTEVLVYIFQQTTSSSWTTILTQSYDLTPFQKGQSLQASEIIEIIANITFSQITQHISLWKICARGVFEPLLRDIQHATSMSTEMLTLSREQELLCKGLLSELS